MPKMKTSFTLSVEVLALLKLLAESNSRSSASMVEVLVKEAAAKAKIKVPKK